MKLLYNKKNSLKQFIIKIDGFKINMYSSRFFKGYAFCIYVNESRRAFDSFNELVTFIRNERLKLFK